MADKTKQNIWVLIETTEDGKAKNVGLELLGPGRMLADKQGSQLTGVVIGYQLEDAARQAASHGADMVLVVDSPELKTYSTEACTDVLYELVEEFKPSALLIGATNIGRDLGPRLSCRLRTGLTADCTALDYDAESGNIAWTRPAFGGNLMATILCPDHRPQIGTVRPGVFKKGLANVEHNAVIVRRQVSVSDKYLRIERLEVINEAGAEGIDLEGAEFIVSAGRGVGGVEGIQMVKKLAEALGATMGASRGAVDAGWIPYAHQVGQTGKTVGPKVYIACGISGAIQHTVGMSGSDILIAINKDPEAPIFNIADYGIVGNVHEIIPILIDMINQKHAV